MIDLQAIEERRKVALENKTLSPEALHANAILSGQDIPALIAEVRRYRELAEVVRVIVDETRLIDYTSSILRAEELLKEVHDA